MKDESVKALIASAARTVGHTNDGPIGEKTASFGRVAKMGQPENFEKLRLPDLATRLAQDFENNRSARSRLGAIPVLLFF